MSNVVVSQVTEPRQREKDLQALLDNLSAALKAVNEAVQPIAQELGKLPKLEAQAVTLQQYQQKFDGLKAQISKLQEELAAAQTKQKEMLAHPEVKAARLAAKKEALARLAKEVAAEEPAEEKPEQSTTDTKEA